MKTIHVSFLEEEIILDEGENLVLVLENKHAFYNFVKYCFLDYKGEKEYLTIFENEVPYDLEKSTIFIPNLFDLNINTKKNINALYKILKQKYYPELKEGIEELQEKAEKIIKEISMDFDISLAPGSVIKEDDLFKLMDIRFEEQVDNLLEDLIKYLSVTIELQKVKIIVLLNLKMYLTNDEVQTLYKEIAYKGITLIDIEQRILEQKLNNEKIIIFDNDCCTIS